ncbi:DNA replication/repair protein RecF [Caldalkalibacillus salinus]|uniref:DNA replication/repair protein RecF n=1 Tax=Caldalkalibacillus salinus TaxID=2803787 RepID=UPI0019244D08
MYVKELHLTHYRNYESLSLQFDPYIHLFIGDNAQGKTNLLESLYVLALAKSHRTNKDKEWISWEEGYTRLQGTVEKRHATIPLELQISSKGKKARLNRIEQQKLSDYVGVLNVVMFAPEDLEIVKGSPQVRRRFIDMELGQMSPHYLYQLTQYQKLLSQRNALLKQWDKRQQHRPMVDIFTEQLIEVAVKIIKKRAHFVQQIEKWANEIHQGITEQKETLNVHYVLSTQMDDCTDEQEMTRTLSEKFDKIREQEEARGTTLVGPHRDDLQFIVNGVNVHTYGSQGQQRTTSLALKLAEIELIRKEVGEYPILLLDDVLSELDDQRRSHLLRAIQNKVQTFVTNTSLEGIHQSILDQSTVYRVQQGKITRMKEGS